MAAQSGFRAFVTIRRNEIPGPVDSYAELFVMRDMIAIIKAAGLGTVYKRRFFFQNISPFLIRSNAPANSS